MVQIVGILIGLYVVAYLANVALKVIGALLVICVVALATNAVAKAIYAPFFSPFTNPVRSCDIPPGWKDLCRDGFKESIVPSGSPALSPRSPLSPEGAEASYLALSSSLAPMRTQEALNNWGTMTSQRCLSLDQREALRGVNKQQNLLQRTNNYPQRHPDSCSAPSHEFLSTFYEPAGAIQATPPSGRSFPPSTQCA